mgnify:CR=1 FL=1
MSNLNNQSALNTAGEPDPLVRIYHLTCALGICEAAIYAAVKKGQLPKADFSAANGAATRAHQWKLSTLRKANPALAESVEILLKIPRTAAV